MASASVGGGKPKSSHELERPTETPRGVWVAPRPCLRHVIKFMNIVIFLPNWVGDAVMATPALRALREHFPDARLIGVMKPYVAGVLKGAPWLDEQMLLDSRGPW